MYLTLTYDCDHSEASEKQTNAGETVGNAPGISPTNAILSHRRKDHGVCNRSSAVCDNRGNISMADSLPLPARYTNFFSRRPCSHLRLLTPCFSSVLCRLDFSQLLCVWTTLLKRCVHGASVRSETHSAMLESLDTELVMFTMFNLWLETIEHYTIAKLNGNFWSLGCRII